MINLSTTYMGLKLKNPVIAGSSGMTNSVEKIKELEKAGASAVVLKSLFEEQIRHEIHQNLLQSDNAFAYPEAGDYISRYSHEHRVDEYLTLIREAKKAVTIPIIASINCVSASEWTSFARRIQEAGADALELNVFSLPSDPAFDPELHEKLYFDIADKVLKQVSIPVSLKISYHFSGLAKTARQLSWTGIKGMVLFNRFFSPDIDINTFKIKAANVLSHPEEQSIPLRWVALLSDVVHCDIAATTGIHDGEAVIKQLLAGAKAVQIASVLYKSGPQAITEMLSTLENWMKEHNYSSIEDFRGKLSFKSSENPAAYERVQFMKHFAGIE